MATLRVSDESGARREYRISSQECRMMKLRGIRINTGEPYCQYVSAHRWPADIAVRLSAETLIIQRASATSFSKTAFCSLRAATRSEGFVRHSNKIQPSYWLLTNRCMSFPYG